MGPVRRLILTTVVLAAVVGTGIASARMFLLPGTACNVQESAVDGLRLETGYDAVRSALGCDGTLVARDEWGPIRRDVYHWRGEAWPFGRLEGVFYNDILHSTRKLWFKVDVALPAGAAPR